MIRRVPDDLAIFQRSDHALEVLTIDHAFIRAHAAPGLQPVKNRVVVWPIDADAGVVDTKHTGAHFERQEVNTDQQNAASRILHGTDVLKTAGVHPAVNTLRRPEPGDAGFHHAHPHGLKILHYHPMTFRFAHLGEAKLQIAVGNFCAALHQL